MKKLSLYACITGLILTLSLFCSITLSHAVTTSGSLVVDEIWSGTINLTGDITVPAGVTLTIETGTEVVFPAEADDTGGGHDTALTELIVNGSLLAVGTEESPILFTSGAFFDSKGDWGGIRINSREDVTLRHCTVEYAGLGVSSESSGGFGSVTVENSLIRHTSGNGILIRGKAGGSLTVTVGTNDVTDNDGDGIAVYGEGEAKLTVSVTGNEVHANSGIGIRIQSTGNNTILTNTITGNTVHDNGSYGIYFDTRIYAKSTSTVTSNEIYNNVTYGLYSYGYPYAQVSADITGNTIHDSGMGVYIYNHYSNSPSLRISDNSIYNSTTGIYCYTRDSGAFMSPVIESNNIYNNTGFGIHIYGDYNQSYNNPTIRHNAVTNNGSHGIYIQRNTGTVVPVISLNEVTGNAGWGLHVSSSGSATVVHNTVTGHGGSGLYINSAGVANVNFNNIADNTGSYELQNDSGAAVDARYNWWGGSPTAQMDAGDNPKNITKIYDIYDDGSKGAVDYSQWLSEVQTITTDPVSWVKDPVDGLIMKAASYTITGTATALAGIERVEVSTDGGVTWNFAAGEKVWTYEWTVPGDGTYTIKSRVIASDDTIELPGAGHAVTIDWTETTVVGTIEFDETWSGNVSLEGDITVPDGVTLTILPGTTVSFPAFFDSTYSGDNSSQSELIVNGTLLAEGTESELILFTSDAPWTSRKGDWLGMRVNGNLRLKNAVVEYATYGIKFVGDEDTDEIYIQDCAIRYNSGHGIDIYIDSDANISAFIDSSAISDNDGNGISCRAYTGNTTLNVTLCNNTISDNGETGIYCFADGGSGDPAIIGTICNNTIFDHTTHGIYSYTYQGARSELTIDNNMVHNSEIGIYTYYNRASPASSLDVTNNTAHTGTEGIKIYTYDSSLSPLILNNAVYDHVSNGIACSYGGADTYELVPRTEGNQVFDNFGNGLYLKATEQVTVFNNGLYNNYSFDLYNDSAFDINVRSNWWGVNTTNEINSGVNPRNISTIFDSFDDSSKGTVDYAEWLSLYDVPEDPTLHPVESLTISAIQTLSGTKDVDASVILNGTEVVPADNETAWSCEIPLHEGTNPITLYSRTTAGMASGVVISSIIRDTTAPAIYSSVPADGAFVSRSLESVDITLIEEGTEIDAEATLAGAVVKDQYEIEVPGQWNIDYNHVVFMPDQPLGVGSYTVMLHPTDTPLGNTRTSTITFTIDLTAPAVPTLNEILTPTKTTPQTISGGKDAGTSIWLDNSQIVPADDLAEWSYNLSLLEGENTHKFYARDEAGNRSDEIIFTIILDRTPPVLQSTEPTNGAFVNESPSTVAFFFTDLTTSLSEDSTLATAIVRDSSSQEVSGTWELQVPNTIVFTPTVPFDEDTYTASMQAYDLAGNTTSSTVSFTYDGTPPLSPTLEAVQSPTIFAVQILSGTKEANASIWLNGIEVIAVNAETDWSYQITLTEGENPLELYSKDVAGNQSDSVFAAIIYDETAPLPVSNLTAAGSGIGTTVTLDWTGYDEQLQGDIGYYRNYAEDHLFTQVAELEPINTVPAGTFTYTADNLVKGTLYYFAVVAVDTKGNALSSVTPVSTVPTDTVAPEDVTNLQVQCFDTGLTFAWNHSANTYGDLAGYKAYFNNSTEAVLLTSSQTTHEQTGLNSATAYPFKVSAYDTDGNESNGISITGVTLLANPANVSVTPYSGYVDITWDGVVPSQLVKHYSVYVSETEFSTVQGLAPRLSTAGTSAKVAGLTNNKMYYFAVTAVNLSDGERKEVGTVSGTPQFILEITSVQGNYISPVSAVDNFRLTIQFNTSMDTSVEPTIEMISFGSTNPVVPDGGTWLTTVYNNDTYVIPDIVLSEGMDGDIQVSVSGAKDLAGNAMAPAVNVYEFSLDATPPASPAVSLLSLTCDAATLSWAAYTPTDDLAGFQVYMQTVSAFTTIEGLSPLGWADKAARTYEIGALALNAYYYAAVVAVDSVGNRIFEVSPVEIYISRPIPPQVSISVGPGNDPDSALVSWHGYDTAGLCGFAGFRLYYEEFDFTSVTGLTPRGTIDAAFHEATVDALDRTSTYYFAVIGFNNADEYDPEVVTAAWSDPYAGQITEDTVIGGGQQTEISISQTMIVTAGATLTIEPGTVLYFAPDTEIQVQSGALIVEGTALDSVVFTSENDRAGSTPAAGDWGGITLGSDAGASILSHVFIKYSENGLTLNGVAPTVTALSCLHNSLYGLRLTGNAELNTIDALIIYNSTGIQTEETAHLIIINSVIKLNSNYNAVQLDTSTLTAESNWWGATEAAGIGTSVSGTVDYEPYLSYEPLFTPAIGTANGETSVGTQEVTLKLACRTAEEMRISEDSTFDGLFFGPFAPTALFTLSEGAGVKTVFAQFRSSTGAVSDSADAFIEITYITEGPEIRSFSIVEGQTVSRPLMVSGEATATLGMDVIEFYLDDVLVEQTSGTTLSFLWDVRLLSNGIYRAKLLTTDLSGNLAVSGHNIIISITPPPAPVISEPADNTLVTEGPVTVRGSAEPFIDVRITRNGFVEGITTADENGHFDVAGVTLIEGDNEIIAVAFDDVGVSANSNRVNVILDTGPPVAPMMLESSVSVGIGVVLQWQYAEDGERPAKFRVYRHDSPFSDSAQATLIEDDHLELTYVDTQASDGTHYYAVVGLDEAGNTSPLSNVVMIDYDRTSPSFGITYDRSPPFGVGPVGITLTTTENLFSAPILTITPLGSSSPEVVGVSKVDEFIYSGTYEVRSETPSGQARVFVSGRDITGNTFVGEPSGVDFVVDTQGPVGSIVTDADEPVQVLADRDINVTLSLSESPKQDTTPILRFTAPVGGSVNIALAGLDTSWAGILRLTPDMGSGNGRFSMEAEDELGNTEMGFSGGEYLEIYNTDVPEATPAPVNLTAISKAGGGIDLSWSSVALAETYSIYRSSGDCTAAPDILIAEGLTATGFTDNSPADGNYCYGVTADRRGAESEMSDIVEAVSDRVAPDPPENVAVFLGNSGVVISWQAPSAGETPDLYYLYRNGAKIRTVTGGLSATDYPSVGGTYDYAVSSVDEVGNESLSDPVTFNLTVGAVSNIEVIVAHGDVPFLSWESSDSSVVGYNIYKGGIRLNSDPIPEASFVDDYYAGASKVRYDVCAVNGSGDESPPLTVEVYPISLEAIANPDENGESRPMVADYFDTFEISVKNRESAHVFPLDRLQLRMTVQGSELFVFDEAVDQIIAEGSPYSESIVIPCGPSVEDHKLKVTAVQTDAGGSSVIYQRDFMFAEVTREGVAIEMITDSLPMAGGYVSINLCIKNKGFVSIDMVVSRGNGAQPGDIYVAVQNGEGLEISRGWYNGFPPGTTILPDGTAYVTLESGASLCLDVNVLIPEALEEGTVLTFQGAVESIYHLYGTGDQMASSELTGTLSSAITQSEYFGTAQADKDAYSNDEVVTISGQAIDRATEDPKSNTGLKIGFYARGFRWFEEVTTDDNGNYTFEYYPTLGLSGHFTIWAAHPDVFDIIHQDAFDIYRMYCIPAAGNIRMSKANTMGFRISLYNPGDEPLTGFASSFRAYTVDGEGNEIDEPTLSGEVDYGEGFVLEPEQTNSVDLQLTAAMNAPDEVNVEYTFISSQGASVIFAGTVSLLPAVPIISVDDPSVGYVDVSLDRGSMLTASVTVSNKGLKDLLGVELILPAEILWMTSNLPCNEEGKILLGDMPVGESKTFDVVFAPPEDTEFGYHHDKIILKGTNSEQEFEVHFYAMVTSSLSGSVHFWVTNILGQEVEGATIRMRNTAIHEDITPVRTGVNGEVVVSDLQEGEWSWQVVASGHYTLAGTITVVADQVVSVEPLLSRNLVTINFTVVPVPFTDRYEIKIEQTFETHVPVPVLVVDPPNVEFENVAPGFEANFVVRVQNYGLIKIHDLTISPAVTSWGMLEPLITYVPELAAMQEIQVPYRATYFGEEISAPQPAGSGLASYAFALGGEPGSLEPQQSGDMASFADCATGGFAGLADALMGLHSALQGDSFCSSVADRQFGFNVIAGVLIVYHIYNAASMITSPISFVGNLVSCIAQQFMGPGDRSGRPAAGGPSYGQWGGAPCFVAGTPIMMADGSTKPIEEIRVSDQVMAFDGKSDRVKRVHKRDSDHVREIWYSTGAGQMRRLETTDDHLFWVNGKEWIPARKIAIGDNLMTPDRARWKVGRNERFKKQVKVYNFDVDNYRSYFAGGVLAHERCGMMESDPVKKMLPGGEKDLQK